MATAKKPEQRHPFTPRQAGSDWLGPAAETCHWCGCDPRNVAHEPPFDSLLTIDTAHGPLTLIPDPSLRPGTFELLAPITDESLIARNHALREALRNVLRLIDRKAFMAHEDLEVVWRAEAALVEDER